LQCVQILEKGACNECLDAAQSTLGGIAAEADTADIDLKPAWIDIRDVTAQPRVISERCPRHRVIPLIVFMSVPFVVASTDLIVTVPRAVAAFFSG
jgi:hypothetical protein